MAAHYFGGELKKTKRFQLGELLGGITRHLLLMTATPHAGKEEDFQLFLALLDRDRFEGRIPRGACTTGHLDGLMRRMVKEDLLTFDGKPLFPERRADTVAYELSPAETDLYERVTDYVREEMNRADQLRTRARPPRNTVGFALTVLQRRLASSPEAILRSLERRRERLEQRGEDMSQTAHLVHDRLDDAFGARTSRTSTTRWTTCSAARSWRTLEEEVVDAATAARTVDELEPRSPSSPTWCSSPSGSGTPDTDRKWTELRDLLTGQRRDDRARRQPPQDHHLHRAPRHPGLPRRRDPRRCSAAPTRSWPSTAASAARSGATVQDEFPQDPDVAVLVATDAAGEGLNLQRAHLMVNYDLPWNPNRIEQRFGRIHRIGQTEVCHLWNLVADNTREGDVFPGCWPRSRSSARPTGQGLRRARRGVRRRSRCATC